MITLTSLRPYTGDVVAPSPNHGDRRAQAIEGIVLRASVDEGDEALSLARMRSPKSRSSCHLFVSRSGQAIRFVGDQQRALHAAGSRWRGKRDVNSITLGIEIANRNDGEPFTDAQYGRVAAIVAHYCRQGLSIDDVLGHGEIARGRDENPRGWDWKRFRAMVQHQLLAADADGRRRIAYDRRSVDRLAADEAATYGSTDVPPPADDPGQEPGADGRAMAAAPALERRMAARRTRGDPVLTTPKAAVRSRMLWLNGLTVLAAGAMLVDQSLDLAHELEIALPPNFTKWALFFVGVVNIILRIRTTRPLTIGPGVRGTAVGNGMPLARRARPGDEGAMATAVRFAR